MSYQPPHYENIAFDISQAGDYAPPNPDAVAFDNDAYTVLSAPAAMPGREHNRGGSAYPIRPAGRARENNGAGGAQAVRSLLSKTPPQYRFVNNFTTTLLTPLGVGQELMVVESADPLGVEADRIQLLTLAAPDNPGDTEVVLLSSRSGTLLTVVRGYEGPARTTPWPIGTIVSARVTAQMLERLQGSPQPGAIRALTAGSVVVQEVTLQAPPVGLYDPHTWGDVGWKANAPTLPGERCRR